MDNYCSLANVGVMSDLRHELGKSLVGTFRTNWSQYTEEQLRVVDSDV